MLLAVEYGQRGKRGFYASWPQAGVPLGLLLSTGVMTLFEGRLDAEAFDAWGWRVPFFLSGLLVVVGLLIRKRISETPLFQRLRQTNQVAQAPLSEAVARYWREILLAAGSRVAEQSGFYVFSVYIVAYAKDVLQVSSQLVLLGVNLAAGLEFFTIPLFGLLSDRLSRRWTYMGGCVFLACFRLPVFRDAANARPAAVVLAIVLSLTVGHAMLYSVQASLIPELFGTRLRYTGASLGYQLASPVAGDSPR